ncbi:unnamed protein product [Protopolystoma xenopodis]|uniref:Uncharacterized protein n=1 Tax=Protopolystoma xenopodis TaxID=117903 RepID=A0A3S5BMJ8_9PLAT|nr:unnamed protein product [Protopolystoma xenopodis]
MDAGADSSVAATYACSSTDRGLVSESDQSEGTQEEDEEEERNNSSACPGSSHSHLIPMNPSGVVDSSSASGLSAVRDNTSSSTSFSSSVSEEDNDEEREVKEQGAGSVGSLSYAANTATNHKSGENKDFESILCADLDKPLAQPDTELCRCRVRRNPFPGPSCFRATRNRRMQGMSDGLSIKSASGARDHCQAACQGVGKSFTSSSLGLSQLPQVGGSVGNDVGGLVGGPAVLSDISERTEEAETTAPTSLRSSRRVSANITDTEAVEAGRNDEAWRTGVATATSQLMSQTQHSGLMQDTLNGNARDTIISEHTLSDHEKTFNAIESYLIGLETPPDDLYLRRNSMYNTGLAGAQTTDDDWISKNLRNDTSDQRTDQNQADQTQPNGKMNTDAYSEPSVKGWAPKTELVIYASLELDISPTEGVRQPPQKQEVDLLKSKLGEDRSVLEPSTWLATGPGETSFSSIKAQFDFGQHIYCKWWAQGHYNGISSVLSHSASSLGLNQSQPSYKSQDIHSDEADEVSLNKQDIHLLSFVSSLLHETEHTKPQPKVSQFHLYDTNEHG